MATNDKQAITIPHTNFSKNTIFTASMIIQIKTPQILY